MKQRKTHLKRFQAYVSRLLQSIDNKEDKKPVSEITIFVTKKINSNINANGRRDNPFHSILSS